MGEDVARLCLVEGGGGGGRVRLHDQRLAPAPHEAVDPVRHFHPQRFGPRQLWQPVRTVFSL